MKRNWEYVRMKIGIRNYKSARWRVVENGEEN